MERGISTYLIWSTSLIAVNEEPAEGQNTDTVLIPSCCSEDKVLLLLENFNKVHFSFVFQNSKWEAIMQSLNHSLS